MTVHYGNGPGYGYVQGLFLHAMIASNIPWKTEELSVCLYH
jgi:hypothetical protein